MWVVLYLLVFGQDGICRQEWAMTACKLEVIGWWPFCQIEDKFIFTSKFLLDKGVTKGTWVLGCVPVSVHLN